MPVATRGRLPLLKGTVFAFKAGVLKLYRLLWPVDKVPAEPNTTAKVVTMMAVTPRRVRILLDSAARAGAQMALGTAINWYHCLDLSLLGAIMSELEDSTNSEDDDSANASRLSEGIDSSSEEAYCHSDLDAHSSASLARKSEPPTSEQSEPAVQQPEPTASQPKQTASQLKSTTSQPEAAA